jgi:hypothetical protein
MMWLWMLAVFLVFGGAAWVSETLRNGQRHRHEQRMEQLRAEERRLRRLEAAKRPPEPVCGCGHHLAKHDRQGHCHETVQVPTGWDADRRPLGFAPGDCACQRYVGPQPLSQVFADDFTDQEPEPPPARLDNEGGGKGEEEGAGEEDGGR